MRTILEYCGGRASVKGILALALLATSCTPLLAQDGASDGPAKAKERSKNPCMAMIDAPTQVRTIYLANVTQPNDANEIQIALRNMLCPTLKIYLVPSQNALVLNAMADQLAIAEKLIAELDRPHRSYRLTYTLTPIENGKRLEPHHLSFVVVEGQRTVLKQGEKVPVITGRDPKDTGKPIEQYAYLDIGYNVDATLSGSAGHLVLHSKVEQSAVADEKSTVGPQEPIIRQSVLEGTAALKPGQTIVLGTTEALTGALRTEIQAMVEPLP